MYKEKPESYKTKFVKFNPEYKYIGGLNEIVDNKRVVGDSLDFKFDKNKKIKTEKYENMFMESADSLHSLKVRLLGDKSNTKELPKINETENTLFNNNKMEMEDLNLPDKPNGKNLGKIFGITKN